MVTFGWRLRAELREEILAALKLWGACSLEFISLGIPCCFGRQEQKKETINAAGLNKRLCYWEKEKKPKPNQPNLPQKQRGKSSREARVVKRPSPSNRLQRTTADGFSVPVKCKSVGSWHAVPWRAEVLTKDMQTWKMYICGKIHPDKWLHLSRQMDFTPGMKLNYCCTSNEPIHGESTWPIKGNCSVIRSFKNYLALCHWVPALSDVCFPANLLGSSTGWWGVLSHWELSCSTNTSCTSHSKSFLKPFWVIQHQGFFTCSLYLVHMKDAFVFGDIFTILWVEAIYCLKDCVKWFSPVKAPLSKELASCSH